jgi:predicted MFS family arabinose efflux permease
VGVIVDRLWRITGGSLRGRVLVMLALVLALDTADVSMIGAIASKLEAALRLSNTQLGLLASVPSLFAAVATLPMGVLTDRVPRVRLLAASVVVWAVAMVASATTQSFEMLLVTRIALGAATATAGPSISSLVGDYFPARERGRVYGLVLSGELLGAGFGFVITGEIASALTWRAAFVVLAAPSLALAFALWRKLPEPQRGGASRLEPGATEWGTVADGAPQSEPESETDVEMTKAQRKVDEQDVPARAELVLRSDPVGMSVWQATRYVLRIPTNVVLIVATAVGYFYFTGVQTFGLVLFTGRYHVSHAVGTLLLALIGIGALAGVVAGGRLSDRLVDRGRVNGRILVGGGSFLLAALLFVPALLLRALAVAMPVYMLAGAAFGAREPALDAARLDVTHHRLWGRAEAVRTVLRRVVTAAAPLVFGVLADQLGASAGHTTGQHGFGANASAAGLHATFLILAGLLALGGLLNFRALRTYPRDVATALASEEATAAR